MNLPINPRLGVFVLTKNSSKYLARTLESLKAFSEVSVYDSGSTDETLPIARQFPNVKIVEDKVWTGFGDQYQKAAESLNKDWVFKVDSDEVLSSELLVSLSKIDLNDERVIFKVKRLNHYRGEPVRVTTWADDEPLRIFNKKHTSFNRAQVHEVIQIKSDSRVERVSGEILHYPYDNISGLLQRMDHYSELFALGHPDKKLSLFGIILRFKITFFKSYILKRGFLQGRTGFLISFCNAAGTLFKYLKISEKN